MHWRWGRIALLVFQAIWLNVIIPGHTRGIVALPGSCCADSCCNGDGHGPARGDVDGARHSAPTPCDKASHCAICQFAARLTLPPVIDFAPPLLGLALRLDPPAPESVESLRRPIILRDRAPPSVA